MSEWGDKCIPRAESCEYGGVYMLFPNTVVTASPTELTVSRLVPITPDTTHLVAQSWRASGAGAEATLEFFQQNILDFVAVGSGAIDPD